eukprot:Rmarinus@m.24858
MATKPKYGGLVVRSKTAPKQQKLGNVFGQAAQDDENTNIEDEIREIGEKTLQKKEVLNQYSEALEEDATIFDYDEAYDTIKSKQTERGSRYSLKGGLNPPKPARQDSKYIGQLMEKARERKLQREMVLHRQAIKEKEQDKELYGDKEVFTTSAYKKRLKEMQLYEMQEKLIAQRESERCGGSMDSFRSNLFNNVSMGGSQSTERLTMDQIQEYASEQMKKEKAAELAEIRRKSGKSTDDVVEKAMESTKPSASGVGGSGNLKEIAMAARASHARAKTIDEEKVDNDDDVAENSQPPSPTLGEAEADQGHNRPGDATAVGEETTLPVSDSAKPTVQSQQSQAPTPQARVLSEEEKAALAAEAKRKREEKIAAAKERALKRRKADS